MSISSATAAPTRHPSGEAHASPRILPLTTRIAQVAAPSGALNDAATSGSPTSSPREDPLSLLSPRDHATGDAPTPTRPTTAACCRPKRIRRRHATRDTAGRQQAFVGCVSDADVAHHAMPQRRHQDALGSETLPQLSRHANRRRSVALSCPPIRAGVTRNLCPASLYAFCRQKRARRQGSPRESSQEKRQPSPSPRCYSGRRAAS